MLGGRLVAEYSSTGVRKTAYAYAGDEALAVQQGVDTASPALRWQHTNPVTGDARETDATGRVKAETHLDPGGADVGVVSPFGSGEAGDVGGSGEGMSQASVDARVASLIPGWGGSQCNINGLSAGYGFVDGLIRSEAGKVCPEGDCGASTARVLVTYTDGKKVTYLVPIPQDSMPSGFSATFTGAAARVAVGMWNDSIVKGEGGVAALYWSLLGGRMASGSPVEGVSYGWPARLFHKPPSVGAFPERGCGPLGPHPLSPFSAAT